MKSWLALIGMALAGPLSAIIMLITVRLFVENRFIPAASMEPALNINDKVLIEKVYPFLRRRFQRGEMIIFHPPAIEMDGREPSQDLDHLLGRLTGLPMFPFDLVFIKRVIGLPGDTIRIVRGQGVFVNGKLLDESSYVQEAPSYDLNVLGDIGGLSIIGKEKIQPYGDIDVASKPILVPPGQLFVLGDNRNKSEDSHVWGLLNEDRITGRPLLKFYPKFELLQPPTY